MSDGKDGVVTKAMLFDLGKSIEAMLPRMTNDMREIKAILGRIEGLVRKLGG